MLEWVAYPFSRTFPTQESHRGLLHCRRILYQLSPQRNPEGREKGSILARKQVRLGWLGKSGKFSGESSVAQKSAEETGAEDKPGGTDVCWSYF